MRLGLALRTFVSVLLGRPLPAEVVPKSEVTSAPVLELPEPKASPQVATARDLLWVLQRDGRLIDFLEEDIAPYKDEEIGAAVREVHRNVQKALREYVTLAAVVDGEEGSKISVPKGYDPRSFRLVGRVTGEPPFFGRLLHRGWRVVELRLPHLEDAHEVVVPAEVEIE